MNKYIHDYADGVKPTFTEGLTFKMMIPIPAVDKELEAIGGAIDGAIEGVIEGVTEGVTEGVKSKLSVLLKAIVANEGYRIPFYKEVTGLPDKSLERFLKQLKDNGLIEFRGESPKTGGYYLTDFFHEILQDKNE